MFTMLKTATFGVALALLCLTSAVSSHAGAATLASNDTIMIMDMGALTDKLTADKGEKAIKGKGIQVYGVSFSATLTLPELDLRARSESQERQRSAEGQVNQASQASQASNVPQLGPKVSAVIVEVDQNSELNTKLLEQIVNPRINNKYIPMVTISYSRKNVTPVSKGGNQEPYFQIKMENVYVSSFELTSDVDGPHVRIGLTPNRISFPSAATTDTTGKE